jgi:hypothetical protein
VNIIKKIMDQIEKIIASKKTLSTDVLEEPVSTPSTPSNIITSHTSKTPLTTTPLTPTTVSKTITSKAVTSKTSIQNDVKNSGKD